MADFWIYIAAGTLHLQRCDSCNFVRYPPSASCPNCGVEGGEWFALGDRGVLRSWTITHSGAADRLPTRLRAEVPYVLGLVEFSDLPDFLLPVRVVIEMQQPLAVGDPVRVELGERRQLVASVVSP
jgi:uncharacterized OB-fold protein